MTQYVLILDTAIVVVAAPSMERSLGFTPQGLSWVANAYTLAFGGLLLLGGRTGDIVGRRRMFIGGLSLFALGSLGGALATSQLLLIIARAVQGTGAAAVSPAALALAMTLFTDQAERNKALGIWGSVAATGAATGYLIGGFLTEWFGWQAVLWVNVPIVAVVVALARMLLPEAREEREVLEAAGRSFDIAGAVTVTAGTSILVYALINAESVGWASAETIGLFIAAAALLAAFVTVEVRSSNPLIPLQVFGIASLRNGNGLTLLVMGAMTPMFFFLSLYLQQVLGFTPIQSGLAQLPSAVCFAALGTPVSKLVSRVGYRVPAVAGGLISAGGMFWLAQIRTNGNYFTDVMAPLTIAALGATLAVISLMIAATADAPLNITGLASGLVNVTQQIGGAVGLAVLSTVAALVKLGSIGRGSPALPALTDGIGAAFAGGAGFVAAAGILAIVLLRKPRRGTAGPDDPDMASPADAERRGAGENEHTAAGG